MKWTAVSDGEKLDFGDYNSASIRQHCKENPRMRYILSTFKPESSKQRKYLHGCLVPLFTFFNGGNYKDSDSKDRFFELAKVEFNPGHVPFGKELKKVGLTSKGSVNLNKLCDGLSEWLMDNGATVDLLDPDKYQEWDATYTGTMGYIEYLIATKSLSTG